MMSYRHITSSLTGQCFGKLVGCTILGPIGMAHFCRCLLSKKARPVMNLIYDLFASILTFSSQVSVGASAGFSPQHYVAICTTCKGFRVTVKLLINGECNILQHWLPGK